MLASISEQRHSNLRREYYHGFHALDPALKSCEEFYLTASFIYAASYAGRKGKVEVYHLKRAANIFNLRCESDFNALQEKVSFDLSKLRDGDWLSFFKGSLRERRELLDIIESLGYDGYFNKEVDRELVKHSVAAGCEADLKLLSSPSVGIFNKDCLEKVETVSDIRSDFRVKRYIDLELDYIEYKLLLAYKNSSSLSDVYDELTQQVLNFDSTQIMSMIVKLNPKDFSQDFGRLHKRFGSIELLSEKQLIYYQRPISRW